APPLAMRWLPRGVRRGGPITIQRKPTRHSFRRTPMARVTRKRIKAAPALLRRLQKHFAADPASLPVVEQQFGLHQRPNLHLAIEELLGRPRWRAELVGVLAHSEHETPNLARLSRAAASRGFEQGPVQDFDVDLPGGRHLSFGKNCI